MIGPEGEEGSGWGGLGANQIRGVIKIEKIKYLMLASFWYENNCMCFDFQFFNIGSNSRMAEVFLSKGMGLGQP